MITPIIKILILLISISTTLILILPATSHHPPSLQLTRLPVQMTTCPTSCSQYRTCHSSSLTIIIMVLIIMTNMMVRITIETYPKGRQICPSKIR